MIFFFILPSNTIFRKTERELSESEIEEEERGREHTPPVSQAPAREITPRERSNPKPRTLRIILVAPQNRSFSSHPKTDRPQPRFVIPNHDLAFAPIAIAVAAPICRPWSQSSHPKTNRPRPQNRSSSLSSFFSQFDRIMIFFFPGFYLCFWIEGWNYIFVWQVRKCEKMCFLCDFDFCCCCGGGVLVVVAFDCRSLLPLPCEKFVGK